MQLRAGQTYCRLKRKGPVDGRASSHMEHLEVKLDFYTLLSSFNQAPPDIFRDDLETFGEDERLAREHAEYFSEDDYAERLP